MREYMTTLGCVLIMTAFAKMLVPEGSIKKYVSLAMGFILISTALSILPGKSWEINFPVDSFSADDGEIAKMEAEYRAAVQYMENCGIVDGYTQERTSAREEYTPDFDLRGI